AQYPMTKADLFAVFMEVCLALNRSNGLMGMINQHSWMFNSQFELFRTNLIDNFSFNSVLHLGSGLFDELNGEVVQSVVFILNKCSKKIKPNFYRFINCEINHIKNEFLKNR